MFTAAIALLTAVLAVQAGWWARDIRDKVLAMYEQYRDRVETPPGVVKLQKRRITRGQKIESDGESGGVMRPRPMAVLSDDPDIAHNIAEQNRRLRR